MRAVIISANAFDDSGVVTLAVEIFNNEVPETIPDYEIIDIDQDNGIISLQLCAERLGAGDGREYTIVITATDFSGNSSTADMVIIVPHDKGKK
jgi:hypothetical protein